MLACENTQNQPLPQDEIPFFDLLNLCITQYTGIAGKRLRGNNLTLPVTEVVPQL